MNKRYQDGGWAGSQWTAGQGEGGGAPAAGESPYSPVLRCGTLVLTGFPVPQPKDRPASPPSAPEKERGASASL